MRISQVNFFVFQNAGIWGFKGGKKAKNDLKLPFQYVLLYVSRTVDHVIKILIMISTRVFLLFFFLMQHFKY